MESPMDIGGNSKTDDAAPSKPQARADIGSALRRQSQGDAPGTSSSERDSVDGERRRARVRIVHQSRRESVTLRIRDPGPLGITKVGVYNTCQSEHAVVVACQELAHDAVTELIWRDKPQNALIVKRPQTQLATDALIDAANLLHRHGVTVYVEPSVYNELQDHRGVLTTWSSEERPNLSKLIDFSISLGGDGTILYMLTLFNNASVPPIVAFALGSLGFLTPFRVEDLTSAVTQALNEVVIDRGPSPFLTQMQLYVDDTFITEIQADGLIIATPTGSTAYSLSAGGSMVHPTVSAILLTPICPHSLSFRPIIVPDSVSLRIEIPGNARHSAWVSLDGRTRTELTTGCGVRIQASKYPVPAAIPSREHDDWYDNIKMHLHWNDRESQKPL